MLGIVLLGRSNCGKSTLGKMLAEVMNMRYISSGDIARSIASENVQHMLNQGELAPENIMRERMLWEINHTEGDFILDGFPRFEDQYKWLNKMTHGIDFIYVVIEAPYDEILCRAMHRNRCDDNSISKKMEMFENYTQPMIEEISKNETTYHINNGQIDLIKTNIDTLCKIVEDYHANDC